MFLIIDGSSMLSTNYYGTLPTMVLMAKTEEERALYYDKIMQTKDGTYTNGVFSSLKQILRIIENQKPEGIAVVFDATRDTFRREIYKEYKGQRSATPIPLKEQFITMENVLSEIGIPVFYNETYEADDFAGAIVKKLEKAGQECVLLSGDKDYYQLVSDKTKLWRIVTSNAKSKYEKVYNINFDEYQKRLNLPMGVFEITPETGIIAEKEVLNLRPEQMVDYLAVVGDKADNIPGVANVGPASIVPLLTEYESLDNIYMIIKAAVHQKKDKELASLWKDKLGVKKNPINALLAKEDDAKLSKRLAAICTDIDDTLVPPNVEHYRLNINYKALNSVINRYSFNSLRTFIK